MPGLRSGGASGSSESSCCTEPGLGAVCGMRALFLGLYSTEYGAMNNPGFNCSFIFSAVLVAPLPQGP